MKRVNRKYELLVIEAKGIIGNIKKGRMDIADLALKACTIKLGGNVTGFYSLSNFADDIGMGRNTLSDWVHARKIEIQLQKKGIKPKNYNELRNISRILRQDKTKGVDKIDKYSNPSKVTRAYSKYKKKGIEDSRIGHALGTVRTLKFMICDSFVLSKLDQDQLKSAYKLTTAISEKLKEHLK